MSSINEICEPYIEWFSFSYKGEYNLVVKTDSKMMYAVQEDKEKGNVMSDILEKVGDLRPKIDVLWGKAIEHGIPTSTYLDRYGSVLKIVRDNEKKQVTLTWIKSNR